MATIGTLGDIVFSVSKNTISTFESMKWDTSTKYATHDRHLQQGLLEFLGTDPGSINFSMYLSVLLGTNPMTEIIKILTAERTGKTMRLIVGEKAYGTYKWVIVSSSKSLEKFDNKGNLWIAKVDISLKEYAER